MTILRHELRQGRIAFIIWTGVICAMLALAVFLYPEMKDQMGDMNEMLSSMGAMTSAFGMDQLDFGSYIGYYALECGNLLGLGGALYAAITAGAILSSEEKNRTAEFLLTHPISRTRVVAEKLAAIVVLVIGMDLAIFGVSILSTVLIGEKIMLAEMLLLHTAFLIMHLEIGCISFGISAFLRRGGVGIALGTTVLLYAIGLLSNITDSVKFLGYVSPFGYCEGADIVKDVKLDGVRIAIGCGIAAVAVLSAFLRYRKKDIH